jgi:hypothetical protein
MFQFGVLAFGFRQNRDIGVRVFPKREEFVVGPAALFDIADLRVRTSKAKPG